MLHSIYDLTTSCRQTTGDVPAKLVGASTTVVGSSMYLFGGRQVAERKMVSDMYHFDMDTLKWSRITPHPDDDVPCPRYFHSSDAWGNLLIIFGGMSNQADSTNPEELCVLDDVRIYDLETRRWLPATADHGPDVPRARYAHLSSVTADRLFIIGGQDFYNTWLDDVCVYDLRSRQWVQRREYPRHCGTYRSVAVSASQVVHTPSHTSSCRLPPPAPSPPSTDATPTGSLVFHPYSAEPTDDNPAEIFLYSNYNFTDVKRELEVFTPHPDDFSINDRSNAMSGTTFPPGLRFPTGALLGHHLIIAGTYLAHSYQSFSIWALDLQTMQWSRIDPGKAVETGSWFRGCLSAHNNKFYIFGNREGSLVDDYNRRLLSWEHVAIVDLEAFGIYQPPAAKVDVAMQELGLSALEEGLMTDFDLVCEDGRKVGVSRKLLDERWPWFREQRRNLLGSAAQAVGNLPTSPMHAEVPSSHQGSDPRLTPRSLHLSEPYPIVLALAQYFYAQALITPLQQAPAVLSQLLILATNYRIVHLAQLVKHAMHRVLSNSTSVGVYEVATLCNCRSLQIRALKTVMAYTAKRPGAKAKDGRGPPPANSGLDRLGTGQENFSRPRGTSDARWRTAGAGGDGSGTYGSKF
ncbi:galactose oxidase [Cylindrobasidium torrendii FP15055 ss-10]|uniref:Galactose oxidase n=1 Tax=Cylindrobasidium torrendii FP15055 ss-10 TaxID=1314674 RepID=A0A0D7BCU2_9AGAR|nr:galactose oxidase [Cylindrobasidium torrendii FP15055 ss-10]